MRVNVNDDDRGDPSGGHECCRAAPRSLSTRRKQIAIWFQLAKIRLTIKQSRLINHLRAVERPIADGNRIAAGTICRVQLRRGFGPKGMLTSE